MTEQQLIEAYHQLANEAMKVQKRLDLRQQHRDFFDKFWRRECCEECRGQEKEYGIPSI